MAAAPDGRSRKALGWRPSAGAGLQPSVAASAAPTNNALAESLFPTLEAELLSHRRFASQAKARTACLRGAEPAGSPDIEGFHKPVRLHSALDYRSPIRYEGKGRLNPQSAEP